MATSFPSTINHFDLFSQEQGFDIRIVNYEQLHRISKIDFDCLSDAVRIENGEFILDAGAGYGAVSQALRERNPLSDVTYHLSDVSSVQLDRAKINFGNIQNSNTEYIVDNLVYSNLKYNYYDKIVAKMVLHEIPQMYQEGALRNLVGMLKKGGKLVIWDVFLTLDNQELVQSIIRKKDELAGYYRLLSNRYFFTDAEFLEYVHRVGFSKVLEHTVMPYSLSTENRLIPEFNGDVMKLIEWNSFIKNKFMKVDKSKYNFKESSNDIQFSFTKKIIVLEK